MKRSLLHKQQQNLLGKNAILLAIIALALAASSAFAADTTWTYNGTSSWFVGANWDHGVPDSSTNAFINNGGTAQITADAPMADALSLTLGLNAGQSGTVQVSPPFGDLSVGGAIFVGKGGKGTLTQTFGTITSATASIASQTGSSGSATVDGTTSTWAVSGAADVGTGGTGLLTVTNGGTVSAASVAINGSGTLTGNGTVSTTNGATVSGTLKPSGKLTLGGSNLSIAGGGTMVSGVTQQAWDNVDVVSGRATLDNTNSKLIVTMTGTFTTPADFPLLHASSGVFGSFFNVSITYSSGCLSPSIVYGTDTVYLHVESSCQ